MSRLHVGWGSLGLYLEARSFPQTGTGQLPPRVSQERSSELEGPEVAQGMQPRLGPGAELPSKCSQMRGSRSAARIQGQEKEPKETELQPTAPGTQKPRGRCTPFWLLLGDQNFPLPSSPSDKPAPVSSGTLGVGQESMALPDSSEDALGPRRGRQ